MTTPGGSSALNVRPLLTRRRLLKLGVGLGGVALLLGGGGSWLLADRPARAGLKVLSDGEASFVEALADALFPAGNPLGVPASAVDVVGGADAYIAGMLPRDRKGLRALLRAIEQWPRMSMESTRRFSELDVPARVEVLRAFDDSSVVERRLLGSLLRTLVAVSYFDDARVLAALSFTAGCEPMPASSIPGALEGAAP